MRNPLSFVICAFIASLLYTASYSQEWKLARISDKDGFVWIRGGQGKDFDVVDTLYEEEYFYCQPSVSEWWKVHPEKDGNPTGYVHMSRICLLETLPNVEMRGFIMKIFKVQEEFARAFVESLERYDKRKGHWNSVQDSINYINSRWNVEYYSDTKYDMALNILPLYYCKTRDTTVIIQLFHTLWEDRGSAFEGPAWALGYCFVCEPELTVRSLKYLNNDTKDKAKGMIAFGLNNVCKTREEEKSLNEILDKY